MKSSSVVSCFCQITSLLHSLPFSRINKVELIWYMHFLLYLIAPREIEHEVNLWGYLIAFKLLLDWVTRIQTCRSLHNQLCFSDFWSTIGIIESKVRSLINAVDEMDNYGGESPTRCNNCVFYSQWLYSTCFGWQSHPSSGVQCCIWPQVSWLT